MATSTAVADAPLLPTTTPMATPTTLLVKLNFIYLLLLFIYLPLRRSKVGMSVLIVASLCAVAIVVVVVAHRAFAMIVNFIASCAEPSSLLSSYPVAPPPITPSLSLLTSLPVEPLPSSSSSSLLIAITIVVVACRAVVHRAVAIVVVVVASCHRCRRRILPSLS